MCQAPGKGQEVYCTRTGRTGRTGFMLPLRQASLEGLLLPLSLKGLLLPPLRQGSGGAFTASLTEGALTASAPGLTGEDLSLLLWG